MMKMDCRERDGEGWRGRGRGRERERERERVYNVKQTTPKHFFLAENIQKTKPLIIKSLVNTFYNVPTMITQHYTMVIESLMKMKKNS